MSNMKELENQLYDLEDRFARYCAEMKLWSSILADSMNKLRKSIEKELYVEGYRMFAEVKTDINKCNILVYEVPMDVKVNDVLNIPAPDGEHMMSGIVQKVFMAKPEKVPMSDGILTGNVKVEE